MVHFFCIDTGETMSMENLILLQEIDTKLQDLNDLLGDLPGKVEQLNDQEDALKKSLIENKNRLKDIEVEVHTKEVRIDAINEKVDKLKDQLFLVTNNKQYDALMQEIDYLKEERSTLESETLATMEEKDVLTQSVEKMQSELESLTQDLSNRRGKLESAISKSAEEKSDLEKKRSDKIHQIDSTTLSVYNRVLQARANLAVVMLSGQACGGCGAHIPAQIVAEVKANTRIHNCAVCRRFLYSSNNSVN